MTAPANTPQTEGHGNAGAGSPHVRLLPALSFACYLGWLAVSLERVNQAAYYSDTLFICVPFVIGIAASALHVRAKGSALSCRDTALCCAVAACLELAVLCAGLSPAARTCLCASGFLAGIIAMHFARHLTCMPKAEILPTAAIAGLLSSLLLLACCAGSRAPSILCVIAPAACGVLAFSRSKRGGDASEQPKRDKLHTAWPLPCAILLCATVTAAFSSLLSNPFIVTAGMSAVYSAVIGSLVSIALLGWSLFARRRNLNGFLVAVVFMLEISLLAFATGLIERIAVPISAIAATSHVLSLLIWIMAAFLSRSPRTRADWPAVFGVFLACGTGAFGRALGFAVYQATDLPYTLIQNIAFALLVIFAIVLLVFFCIEVVVMRQGIEDEAARQIELVTNVAAVQVSVVEKEAALRVARVQAQANLQVEALRNSVEEQIEQVRKQAALEIENVQSETASKIAQIQQSATDSYRMSMRECCAQVAKEYELTEREHEAIMLMCEGMTRAEIAKKWVVSENTVKYHLRNAYRKLDVHNTRELISLVERSRAVD